MPTDSEKKTPGVGLSVRQRQAAVLDAADFRHKDIATILDLHEKTVAKWGQSHEEYQAAVEQYRENRVQELAPMVERIQLEMTTAVLKAIRTISAAMDAQTRDGSPSWAARLRGAADALNHAKLIAPATLNEKPGEGNNSGGPQYAVIRVEIPGAQEAKKLTAGSSEVIEAREVKEEKALEAEGEELNA